MKNYISKADKKTSSTERQYSMFVGRWQPLHLGHQWLFNQSLEEEKNVLICIRDVKPDDKNPFTPEEVKLNIENHYGDLITEERVKVIIIPDIESINYGSILLPKKYMIFHQQKLENKCVKKESYEYKIPKISNQI
jgi:cytidyltransferase-like protein